jgi:hypothetical protein
MLIDAGKKLGPLCPACLAAGPKAAGQRLREKGLPGRHDLVASLATRLSAMPRWEISLAQLLEREKGHLAGLFPKMTEEDLRTRVVDRCREYLE